MPQHGGIWTLLLIAGLGLGAPRLTHAATELRVVGSDVLAAAMPPVLAARAVEFEQTLSVQLEGTRLALDRIDAGLADLAFLIDYPGAPALPDSWMAVPLGFVPTLLVVPATLPVEQVSLPDLAEVFAASSAKPTLRWTDLGAQGEAGIVPVSPLVADDGAGVAESLFRHRVLQEGEFKGTVLRPGDLAATFAAAAQAEGALVVTSRLPAEATDRFKVLLVAADRQQMAFSPTAENLQAGDYPLSLTLRLAFPRNRAPELLDWLRYCHGEVVAEVLRRCGVVPLLESARAQQSFDLELIQ